MDILEMMQKAPHNPEMALMMAVKIFAYSLEHISRPAQDHMLATYKELAGRSEEDKAFVSMLAKELRKPAEEKFAEFLLAPPVWRETLEKSVIITERQTQEKLPLSSGTVKTEKKSAINMSKELEQSLQPPKPKETPAEMAARLRQQRRQPKP